MTSCPCISPLRQLAQEVVDLMTVGIGDQSKNGNDLIFFLRCILLPIHYYAAVSPFDVSTNEDQKARKRPWLNGSDSRPPASR